MTLGREIDQGLRTVLFQQIANERAVADIALNELDPTRLLQIRKIFSVTRISQRIQYDDSNALTRAKMREAAADKSGTTGDDKRKLSGSRHRKVGLHGKSLNLNHYEPLRHSVSPC